MEGEIIKTIKTDIGVIRIHKSNRETTQQEIENFYKIMALAYLKNKTAQ